VRSFINFLNNGIRKYDRVIERPLKRILLYNNVDSIKIDTYAMKTSEIVASIINYLPKKEKHTD